uniref:Uncharacterized protein n=1 Tax=Opuntia streptacantha TaxID=393608 RepID=A0A7C9CKH3_OPUST
MSCLTLSLNFGCQTQRAQLNTQAEEEGREEDRRWLREKLSLLLYLFSFSLYFFCDCPCKLLRLPTRTWLPISCQFLLSLTASSTQPSPPHLSVSVPTFRNLPPFHFLFLWSLFPDVGFILPSLERERERESW